VTTVTSDDTQTLFHSDEVAAGILERLRQDGGERQREEHGQRKHHQQQADVGDAIGPVGALAQRALQRSSQHGRHM